MRLRWQLRHDGMWQVRIISKYGEKAWRVEDDETVLRSFFFDLTHFDETIHEFQEGRQ